MTKLSIETFNYLKRKHGNHSSWAVWEEETNGPKSNMDDLSIFENEKILEFLNPKIILVPLNFSIDVEMKPLQNFHGKNGYLL